MNDCLAEHAYSIGSRSLTTPCWHSSTSITHSGTREPFGMVPVVSFFAAWSCRRDRQATLRFAKFAMRGEETSEATCWIVFWQCGSEYPQIDSQNGGLGVFDDVGRVSRRVTMTVLVMAMMVAMKCED